MPTHEPQEPESYPPAPGGPDQETLDRIQAKVAAAQAEATKSVVDEQVEEAEMTPVLIGMLTEADMQRLQHVGQYNLGVDLAAAMFDTLVDTLAPPGSAERDEFEQAYQAKVGIILDMLDAELDRRRITQGVPTARSNGRG